MPQVRESIEISAPAESVWEIVMDPARFDEWVTAHERVKNAPKNVEEGDSFEQVLCLGGRPIDVEWTLVESDPPNCAEWDADGPRDSGAKVRYLIEADGGASSFVYENDFDLPGGLLGGVAGRFAGAPAKRAVRKSLKRLKALAESEA